MVFVPGAWEGEQVKAEIVEERKGFVKARLVEVVEKSPERLERKDAAVPGMVYAGLSYEGEERVKMRQLEEFFERARIKVGAFERLKPSPKSGNYRNKVVYHFAKQAGKWVIGYRTEPSHEIIDIECDPLARPEINRELPNIRKAVTMLLTSGPEAVRRETAAKGNVTIRWTLLNGVKWWIGEAPKELVLKETTLGEDFEVPAGGFYQVNPEVGEALVKDVVDEVKDAKRLLDLYCGVGVFGLASGVTKLIGIESGRQAIEAAKRNATALKASEAKFFAEEVGRNLRRIPIGGETTVVIDPPRGGLEKGVARWLAGSKAPKIVYVSCDPATLMRDLRELSGAYEVRKVKYFNMFPRTARFETLVIMEKISG